tara:strand:+ start:1077 stop:1874 length:798 start_codon:yes stop_codon:yes gene_type:complete
MKKKKFPSKQFCFWLFLTILLLTSLIAESFDADREQRIASQTLQTLFLGEPIWLEHNKSERSFLGLVTPTDDTRYVILMIHGTGQGPNTPYVIGPMRELLSDIGYGTLSVQMPVLSDDENYDNYMKEFAESRRRIGEGVKFLRETSPNSKIIILGHSMGSTMLMDWLFNNDSIDVSGFIAIGLGSTNQKKLSSQVFSSRDINLPILDILGENDYDSVLWSAPLRKNAILATHKKSAQIVIEKADHFFTSHEEKIALSIKTWIKNL